MSEEQHVHYGTPQESCLEPLIFLIFVNDLHLHLSESECIQFADDTTLMFTHHNLNYLHFWIDDHLSLDMHVNKLLNKLKCGIGMLKCSKYLLTSKAKRLLYFGQIHSYLSHSLCIWGSMLQNSMINKLAKAQETAVKLIDPADNIDELFRKHKILKFINMLQVEQCKMGYKLCHSLLPKALLKNMILDHKNHSIVKNHRYSTRSKAIPNLPNVSGNKYRSSFLFTSIKAYSALDNSLKVSRNLNIFVRKCKELHCNKPTNH